MAVPVEEASSSSPEELAPKPKIKARDFALNRLARRAHSEAELSRKMARAGYAGGEIAQTLDFLRERNYVDDGAFALDFARARSERRQWGPARIEMTLKTLGLASAHIDSALQEIFSHGEHALGERALARFLSSERRRSDPQRRKARAYRHLLARGFAPETVHELVSSHDFEDTDGLETNDNT